MTARITAWVWAAIAVAALILPLPPLDQWSGAPAKSPTWWPHVTSWAIGALVVVTVGLLAGRLATRLPSGPRLPPLRDVWLVGALALLVVAVSGFLSEFAFAGNPHLVDEMAQLLHARAVAAGMTAAPAPVPADAFLVTHTWITPAGWVSQYPPGQTVLFAGGLLLGAERWVNPVLGGAGTILVFLFARTLYGRSTALAAAALWAASAWVWFMSASYMNHVGATTFALASWALVGVAQDRRWLYAGSGLALALAAATRPIDGLAAALPLAAWLVIRRRWHMVPWVGLGGLPVAVAWALLNWKLYGHPLTLGYDLLYGEEHSLGFHTDPWGERFTPFISLSNAAVAVRRLHLYMYEWPIPALLPLALWAVLGKPRTAADLIVGLGLLSAPALYFWYWHSGFFLGPRFYYAIAPFIAIATARAWSAAWAWARARSSRFVRWDVAVATTSFTVLLWSGASLVPARAQGYADQLPSLKLHPERELKARGVTQALILVPTSWGDRILVDLWALGAKPGLAERAYRLVDACDLDRFRRRAREGQWTAKEVAAALDQVVQRTPAPAPEVEGWPDPTLRLTPGRALPPRCEQEMARDLAGFTVYGNLAWRNAVNRDRGLVFARDLYERNAETFTLYGGWDVWRYAPPFGQPNAMPVLTRIGTLPLNQP